MLKSLRARGVERPKESCHGRHEYDQRFEVTTSDHPHPSQNHSHA